MTKHVHLNGRIHIVEDELADHIAKLREDNMKYALDMTKAREVIDTACDRIDDLCEKIRGGLFGGH